MKKNPSKVVCVRLNEKTINEINNACNELNIDFSDFVRGAIAYSLKTRAKKQNIKGGGDSINNKQWCDNYFKQYANNYASAENYFNDFYDNYMKENAEEIAKNDERIKKMLEKKGGDS